MLKQIVLSFLPDFIIWLSLERRSCLGPLALDIRGLNSVTCEDLHWNWGWALRISFIFFWKVKNSLECPLRALHNTDKPNLWSLASSSPSELHSVVLPTNAKESIQHSYTKLHGYFKAPLFKTQEPPLMCTFQLSNQCWSIFSSEEQKILLFLLLL